MKKLCLIIFQLNVLAFIVEAIAQSPVEKADSTMITNRHDFVPQGNHPSEMKLGTYVIVGTALTEDDAQLTIKQLLKLKYPDPSYGYLTNKSLWYIYYGGFKELEEAQLKRDDLRKFKMYKSARLLTVHE